MSTKATDDTAAAVAASSPAWATALGYVNQGLTMLSLLLGIAFLLWRWKRAAVRDAGEEE